MKSALLLALLLAAPVAAQEEDAAHRADRLETQRLNNRSWNGFANGRHRGSASSTSADSQRAYDKARSDYQDRLDAWRRRVAACESGHYEACQ